MLGTQGRMWWGAGGWGAPSITKAPRTSPPVKPAVGAQPRVLQALTLILQWRRGNPAHPPNRQEAMQSLRLAHLPDSTRLMGHSLLRGFGGVAVGEGI